MKRGILTCWLLLLAIVVLTAAMSCKKKERNEVDLEQIEIDGSTNYRYIFKDAIRDEIEKSRKKEKNPFAD